MKLPPFGKKFQPVPISGVRVCLGPGAWGKAKGHAFPIMVLPQDKTPSEYRWPSDGGPALIFECGTYDDNRLRAMAEALLIAGASSVVAIREALLNDYDSRKFFDAEVIDVAA